MFGTSSKLFLYAAYRLRAGHVGADGSKRDVFGTCFYVRAGADIFLVSNRHLLFLAWAHEKYAGFRPDSLAIGGYFGVDQYAECDFAGQQLRFGVPLNETEDVVAVRMTGVHFAFRRRRKPGEDPGVRTAGLSPIALGIEMLAEAGDFDRLNPGDMVAFPSYPELYDHNGARPILRTGTIASDPLSDYGAKGLPPGRRLAYDAHSTQGSSGSPVFAVIDSGKTGMPANDREAIVVGINAGHLVGDEPRIGTIHAGLSFAYKSACILEAINNLRSEQSAA
jgi:hypothetical protein